MKQKINLEERSKKQDFSNLNPNYQSVFAIQGLTSKEIIENIPLSQIIEYIKPDGTKQPFKIKKEKIQQIKKSAEDIGIISPIIVRRYEDKYQIISGHHRYIVAQELNFSTIPCIIRDISDEQVEIHVVESNIQRMKLLPSEYASIFSVYMNKRKDIKMSTQDILDKFGISRSLIYLYLNLVKIIPELQDCFDTEDILIACADIFHSFSEINQKKIVELVRIHNKKINKSLAKKIKQLLDEDSNAPVEKLLEVFEKPNKDYKNKIYCEISKEFNITLSEKELDEITSKLLREYFSNN